MTPRAVLARAFGPPESFSLEAHDPGPPGPGAVRISVRAAGVGFVDVLVALGQYQLKPPLPFVPGSEFAGVIEAVGPGVDPSRIGERVCATAFGAAFAEAATVPAKLARTMPAGMSFAEGAVFLVSYATAYHALVQRGRLARGETLLVLGAAGAVGTAAVQLGKILGATVIASASTPEKRALAQSCGADAVIDSGAADWREQVKSTNGGRGVDVVLDPIGGEATERAFRSLAWNGRHLVIGFAQGTIPKLPTNLALLKGAALVGVDIRQMGQFEPELAAANLDALFRLYGDGYLRPPIGQTYRLEEFAVAMAAARLDNTAGRIVLTMGER